MAISSLPAGFRFHPTDIELVMYYLKRKVMGKKFHVEAISELNIYQFSPWDLPDKSCLKSKDREWYFFCPREKKYASGPRMNRATETGFWKTTGKDRTVSYNDRVVGRVKTLIFHEGNAPHGNRTDWVLHEYRLEDKNLMDSGVVQDSFVLCKVFQKSGPGPKNGAQYGALFNEEEWEDDIAVIPTLPCDTTPVLPEMHNFSQASGLAPPGSGYTPLIAETLQSQLQSSSENRHHNCQNYPLAVDTVDPWSASGLCLADVGVEAAGPFVNDQFIDDADDITLLLSAFVDDDVFPPNDSHNIQNLGSGNDGPPAPQLNASDPFNGLQYLHDSGHGIEPPSSQFHFDQSNLTQHNTVPFLEIADIDAPFVSAEDFSGQDPSSGGLYGPYRPSGPEHSMFTGMSNADNSSTHRTGRPFDYSYGTSFGPQLSYPIFNELPALPNMFGGGLVPQAAIGYNDIFPQEFKSTEQQHYPASYSQLRNSGGGEDIQKSSSSCSF